MYILTYLFTFCLHTGALRTAYLPAQQKLGRPPLDMSQFFPLLSQAAFHPQPRARLAAVEWSITALPPSLPLPRCLCLYLLDDPIQAVRKAALAGLSVPFLPSTPAGQEDEFPPYPEVKDMMAAIRAGAGTGAGAGAGAGAA